MYKFFISNFKGNAVVLWNTSIVRAVLLVTV